MGNHISNMSYDLMAFNPTAAPRSRTEFMKWYNTQSEWEEAHSYDDPENVLSPLKDWLMHFMKEFPAMNGPCAASDDMIDDPHVTSYSMGQNVVYCAFAWSLAEPAFKKMKESTKAHGVGFFNVSAEDGEIVFPDLEL
ncbi:hypothetical protein BGE01nite_52130 [Brevifollis gellanilyticus]|uniref:Uncharacterized protein n=2 Tax=Brevifollis gellanilyticus TaxID=748831 RepID=A0A512MGP4_9BACT|nr:hypothetical protein BGE01nite_52130 [Brevifollis gellanilyticus]